MNACKDLFSIFINCDFHFQNIQSNCLTINILLKKEIIIFKITYGCFIISTHVILLTSKL